MTNHKTIVRINQVGRMGNHMAQLMFARKLQVLCKREISIEGFELPDWNLHVARTGSESPEISIGSHLTRADLVARLIDRMKPPVVNLDGVILRASNFRDCPTDDLFPVDTTQGQKIPSSNLLVNVRLGDVEQMSHPHYGPLPISYYRYLAEKTGLTPMFMGELSDCAYVEDLRKVFPESNFLPQGTVRGDFETVRSAKNIAIAVSTFSYFGAALSKAAKIHVPIAGMLNPKVRPDIDLLDLEDARFVFHSIDQSAWTLRYKDNVGNSAAYGEATRPRLRLGKALAAVRTMPLSTRIHAGLALRMLRN